MAIACLIDVKARREKSMHFLLYFFCQSLTKSEVQIVTLDFFLLFLLFNILCNIRTTFSIGVFLKEENYCQQLKQKIAAVK